MSEILSDTESILFVFYIASPTPWTEIGLGSGNSQSFKCIEQSEIYRLLQSCELRQTEKRGSLLTLCLPEGTRKAPARTWEGRPAQLASHSWRVAVGSVAAFCLVNWRSCQGKQIIFWQSFFLRFFILKNKKIFPSNKSNDDSKGKCLQKRARLSECKQIKTD